MICASCDRYCSWVGRYNGTDWWQCFDGCGARWEGPEPYCVDFMDDDEKKEDEVQAA